MKAAELRIKELEAQNLVLRNALVHLKHIASEGKSTALAMVAVENALTTTPAASLAFIQADAFSSPVIEPRMKAGCAGEFEFTIENGSVCSECYVNGYNADCKLCDGESSEMGLLDLVVSVPWNTQKDIFKRMCDYKGAAIRERAQEPKS